MPRVILQISDVHFPAEGRLFGRVDADARLAAVLSAVEASHWRPELLLVSGDLADHGHPDAYRRLRPVLEEAAARLGAPLMVIPGNHDDVEHFERELLDREPGGRPLDQLRMLGGLRVIALDSSSRDGHHGTLLDGQLQWLAAQLAEPAPEGTILALHHPPVPSPLAVMADMQLRAPQRLAEVVAGSDVRMILCGHDHHVAAGTLGGVTVWASAAVAYTLNPLAGGTRLLGTPEGGFTLVEVHPHTVVATNVPVPDAAVEPVLDDDIAAQLAVYAKD